MQTIYLTILGIYTAVLVYGALCTFSTKESVELDENTLKSDLNLSDKENEIYQGELNKIYQEDLTEDQNLFV